MKGGINYRKESVVYERLFKGEWFKTQTCLPKKQPADCNNFWLQSASAIYAGIASLLLFLRQIIQHTFLLRTAKHQAYPGKYCKKGQGAGSKTAAYFGSRPHFCSGLGFRFDGSFLCSC